MHLLFAYNENTKAGLCIYCLHTMKYEGWSMHLLFAYNENTKAGLCICCLHTMKIRRLVYAFTVCIQ